MPGPGCSLHLTHHLAAVGNLLAGAAGYKTGRGRQFTLMPRLVGHSQQNRIKAGFSCIVVAVLVLVIVAIVVVADAIALAAAARTQVVVAPLSR